jgi:hypothetical protein
VSEERRVVHGKMRWIAIIAFGVMTIRPWIRLVHILLGREGTELGFVEFPICCIIAAIAFLFALARQHRSRVATVFFGFGYLVMGFGLLTTQRALTMVSLGIGLAILNGSLFAMFIGAIEEGQGRSLRLGNASIFATKLRSIIRSINAWIVAACGVLLLFAFLGLCLHPFTDLNGISVINWGITLLTFLCCCILYSAMLEEVLYQRELMVEFWGKWILYLLPTKRMVIGATLITIPLMLSFTWFTKLEQSVILVFLAAMLTEVVVVWKSKVMHGLLMKVSSLLKTRIKKK